MVKDSKSISESALELKGTFQELASNLKIAKSSKLVKIYETTADLMDSWSSFFSIQAQIVNSYCVDFFKFYSLEQTALKELKEKVK